MARTIKGKAMTAAASAAPCQVKGRLIPKLSNSQRPRGPCRPSRSSRRYPTTTGGKTKGKCEFILYSFDVKVEGKNVCRNGDMMTHNDKNALG